MKLTLKFLLVAMLVISAGIIHAKPNPTVKITASDIVDRHLSGFSGINVAGPFDVRITQGETESVKVEAPADVIARVLTEVNNGVLKVYQKHDGWHWGNWWGHHKKIMVYVTAKNLNSISVSGSGDVDFKNGITANALKLHVSGSGDLDGKVDAKTVECSISGSGDVKLSGRATNSTVSVSGSGDYAGGHFETATTAVRVSGSGDAEVYASEKLDAAVHGSGDVHYRGSPKSVSKSKSGSGDISGS